MVSNQHLLGAGSTSASPEIPNVSENWRDATTVAKKVNRKLHSRSLAPLQILGGDYGSSKIIAAPSYEALG